MKYNTDSRLEVIHKRLTSAHYEKSEAITNQFEVFTGEPDMLCGNVRAVFNTKGQALLCDTESSDKYNCWERPGYPATHVSSYEQISSALALYRTVSLFKCGSGAERCDFYKMNWEVILKHKKTGLLLSLGEWKGGFQIFTSGYGVKELPKTYACDVKKLLTLLASDVCPIGYDGVVAGTVA